MSTPVSFRKDSPVSATVLAAIILATITLTSLSSALAYNPPHPPRPSTCTASTMQFVAAYERDPAWVGSYHTMIKNLHWVTSSYSVGPVTVIPDPSLNWGTSYAMWWKPYFEPIAKLNGSSQSSVIPTKPWYMECSGNTAYSVKSTVVVFNDGGIKNTLKIYNTTVEAEYPENYNTQYEIRWDVCFKFNSDAHAVDLTRPRIIPLWEYLSDTIDELIRSDTYDGPVQRKNEEATEDAEALDLTARALIETLYTEEIPPELEDLRWEVIDRLERVSIELDGARDALQQGGDAGDNPGAVEYFIVAQAHVHFATDLMNEVEELLAELSSNRD